jgi:hypothetical protein
MKRLLYQARPELQKHVLFLNHLKLLAFCVENSVRTGDVLYPPRKVNQPSLGPFIDKRSQSLLSLDFFFPILIMVSFSKGAKNDDVFNIFMSAAPALMLACGLCWLWHFTRGRGKPPQNETEA